jgi:hypothetical protein
MKAQSKSIIRPAGYSDEMKERKNVFLDEKK